MPFPPDDPQRGDTFEERVKALLRRHVVERCIYGVDINPLAVEFARVSLWVETLDPELPFSFLDHKIKVGNSLVGCWLDRVEDYPLKAWEREGGDGKDGPRTQRIETFLKGEKVGNRRSGDGSDQAGDAGGHREPASAASRSSSPTIDDHDRGGRRPRPEPSTSSCTICRSTTPTSGSGTTGSTSSGASPSVQRSRRRWTSGAPSGSGPPTRSRCGTSPRR